MIQWNLTIPEKTDQAVRAYLSQKDSEINDLSKFVDEAVRQKIFRQIVQNIKNQNASRDQQELMDTINEAVDWARENCS